MYFSFAIGQVMTLLLCAVFVSWRLLQRKAAGLPAPETREARAAGALDYLIVLLCFAGIFLTPMHIREPFLQEALNGFAGINFPCALAVLLSLLRIRRWTKVEMVCFAVWMLLLIPMCASNGTKQGIAVSSIVQTLVPLFLLLYPMNPPDRRKLTGLFVILFDVIILVLLVCAVADYFGEHLLLQQVYDWMKGKDLSADEFGRYLEAPRLGFLWGHALTNAVYFNAFFVLNVLWLRACGKKCPVPVFFGIAMFGILSTTSKTGLAVCVLLLIVMTWNRKSWKWLLVCIPIAAALYFGGVFNAFIERFNSTTLTTGRAEALQKYFSKGITPLQVFSGYGSRSILSSSSPVYKYRAGFEFPLLMHAYYYGIVFSVLHIGGTFAYVTWRFLKEKKWFHWVCWLLLFAEVNTYNAYALRNQDVCFFFCLLTVILMHMPEGNSEL